jgi:hypothetical protein
VAQLDPQQLRSLFVTSYDSQGYNGGIWTHLHTGFTSDWSQSQSYITTDSQSDSLSWCQAISGAQDHWIFMLTIYVYSLGAEPVEKTTSNSFLFIVTSRVRCLRNMFSLPLPSSG